MGTKGPLPMGTEGAFPMGTRDRAPSGPLTRVLAVVRGALGLVARSAFALVRVFLAGCALLAVLMVPVWLWAHVVIDALDIKTVDDLTQGEQLTRLLLLLAVPTVAVLGVVALSLYGGATVVLDDVATGRRPRAVRSLLRGLASAPRLLVSVVPAVVVMAALAIAAPAVTLVGLVLALVTSLGRRVRPSARWPSRRTLVVLCWPVCAAALCATRWSIVPSVVVLERAGVRAAYRRAASLSRGHLGELALSFALLTVGGVALWRLAGAVLSLTDASLTAHDALAILIEGFVLLLVAAIAVRLFVEAGGVSEELSEPMPPRVHVSMVVLFALVAGLAPMVSGVRPAGASVAGATIVVNDLGDASDALPGDGVCATASGTCTLRAAITESNTSIDEVIGFNVSGTITVASQLTITAPVVIDGAAAGGKVGVSGGGTARVFCVQIDGIPGGGLGNIRNLTVADSRGPRT